MIPGTAIGAVLVLSVQKLGCVFIVCGRMTP
jgi:hypothetical protein